MERVSKPVLSVDEGGAGLPRVATFAAPFDTAFTTPFGTLRTQFRPTQDAYGYPLNGYLHRTPDA